MVQLRNIVGKNAHPLIFYIGMLEVQCQTKVA